MARETATTLLAAMERAAPWVSRPREKMREPPQFGQSWWREV